MKLHEVDWSYMELSHLVLDQRTGPLHVALPVDSQSKPNIRNRVYRDVPERYEVCSRY